MKKFLIAIFTLSIMVGCSKEELFVPNNEEDNQIMYLQDRAIEKQDHKFDKYPDKVSKTILGKKLNNPFSYNNMLAAAETLSRIHRLDDIEVYTTDIQVKFMPRSYEDVKKLFRDTLLILFDFPLSMEVIEMGDYYIEPGTQDEIPAFYCIVSEDQNLPEGIPFEVVEKYAYLYDKPLLIVESFRSTGNFEYVNDYIAYEDFSNDDIEILTGIEPPMIECPPECPPVLVQSDDYDPSTGSFVYEWICDCNPDGGGGGIDPPTNDCGCPVYTDQRKPGGCINVENNSINNMEGVNKVRVIIKDYRYGRAYQTWTDANGCWKYNKRFKGRMWMWVEFLNADSAERCYRNNWKPWEWLIPVKDKVGTIWGPNFNDVEVIYNHWGNQTDTQAQRYWGAATVNNEVQIYLDETDDIDRPPVLLDVLLLPNRGDGSAIMGTYWPSAAAASLIPDVTIGIDNRNRNEQDELCFHEIAHTSHFSQVGFEWWSHLIVQKISNAIVVDGNTFTFEGDPWGEGDEPDAGYVALAESWAENVSTDLTSNSQEGIVFVNGYIPMGLYEDLEDDTPWETVRGIRDRVSGFSRAAMFNSLNSNVTTVNQYQFDLIGSLPAGNTLTDYNDLFRAYMP